jgi:hypothetical protein
VANNEYTFRIDVFTPDTLPMARLAEYMAALAELIGSEASTHFVRLDPGSARVVARIEEQDAPKVLRRLSVVEGPSAALGVAKAFRVLDDLLAGDNAVGEVISPEGAVIIPFPGRERPKPLAFPAFRQDGALDGEIVSIGGKDKTAHIILRDGAITYSNIELTHALAKELAKYLYGPKVRLIGRGRWERHPDGAWKLLNFSVDRYDVLDNAPLSEVLADIRGIPDNGLMGDPAIYDELMSLRLGDDGIH